MLYNENNEKEIPEVEFTFDDEGKSKEEIQKEINELIKKRNEIYAKIMKEVNRNENGRNNMLDKMYAGIIGFAVGDALGVPVEFKNRSYFRYHKIKDMIGFGSHSVPAGTWSDDTSLIIATMDSIRENGNINYEDIMHKFTEWVTYAKYTATDKLFDIGISTSKAISNFEHGQNAINCGGKSINENGNGSLMRILPFVYYLKLSNLSKDEKTMIINQASSLTHAHEISCLGCKIYSDYLTMLLDGIDKITALDLLKENKYEDYYSKESVKAYQRILNGDLKMLTSVDIKSTGYVVDTLEASLWCTIKSNCYEEAVIRAVNLGNDTDTIGAITGSINGIIYGKNCIPERWLEKLIKKDYLIELSEQFLNTIIYKNEQSKKR